MKVQRHFATSKQKSAIQTCCSHIRNMIVGLTKGYVYKMRLVYSHFPINIAIVGKDDCVEIRNYLGEKIVRKIQMLGDVKAAKSSDVKDQLEISGNDIQLVSRSAALISQSCFVKGSKDIRKFLDGIYVSEKGTIIE